MFSLCLCGCGKEVINEKNKFLVGHNMRGKSPSKDIIKKMSDSSIGKIMSVEARKKMSDAKKGFIPWNKGLLGCQVAWNKGKQLPQEMKDHLSKINTGKKQSPETIAKRVKSNTGKKRSDDVKIKMSISAIEYLEMHTMNGKRFCPRIGDNETPILNQIEKSIDIKFLRNNRDVFNKCGKWPDAYLKEYNIVIDILEPHHFKSNGDLTNYDKNRELIIASKLGCMIYYVSEQEFLKNPDNEIQRFEKFIELVKIC